MQSAPDVQLQPRPRRNEEKTLELNRENRRITFEEFAGRLNLSVGSVYSLIYDSLKCSKVCARWVPKELTEESKPKRLDDCSRHSARYREDDNFLQQMVVKHGFTITSPKASGIVYNGSIHHLL